MTDGSPRPVDEVGAGSVLGLGAIGVVLALTVACLHLGAGAVTAHRARAAADLSALAGASALQEGHGAPCTVAAAVALRNGARVLSCRQEGAEVVQLRVSCPLPVRWPGLPAVAVASARAGPGHVG